MDLTDVWVRGKGRTWWLIECRGHRVSSAARMAGECVGHQGLLGG